MAGNAKMKWVVELARAPNYLDQKKNFDYKI